MTLSKFVREYLYNPISLSLTRYAIDKNFGRIGIFILSIFIPPMLAFICVGLWHGAGWNFILFGVFHGVFIVIHNIWVKSINMIPGNKRIKEMIYGQELLNLQTNDAFAQIYSVTVLLSLGIDMHYKNLYLFVIYFV